MNRTQSRELKLKQPVQFQIDIKQILFQHEEKSLWDFMIHFTNVT